MKVRFYKTLMMVGCMLLLTTAALAGLEKIEVHAIDPYETTVRGEVTDSEGEPLPGASVQVEGTTIGVVTDVSGKYELSVQEDATLVFSFIGFISQKVRVAGQTIINVALENEVSTLNEIVVVGYGTQKKSDLTGAFASAPLEAFEESSNTNILQALSGSTPGITIGQVTTAGQEPDIQIRGRSTINGNEEPLIVLDGVYYRGRLADLNPKDIESVTVLKDPSSKAVYGAQAANGVVIISTKGGGREEEPVISYSGIYSTQTPSNYLTPLGREGFLKRVRDIDWVNGYIGPDYTEVNPNWNPETNSQLWPQILDGLASDTHYDWLGEVTDPGFISDHQLSVRGGSEKTTYYLSGGYTKQNGWVLNDKYKRITGRINLDTDITPWLTIGTNTYGAFANYSGESPNLGTLQRMPPVVDPWDENGDYVIYPVGQGINPFLQSSSDDRDLRNNISALLFAQIKVPQIEGLSYRVNFSNNYRWDALSNSSIYEAAQTGRAIRISRTTHDVLLDNIVTYDRKLGEDHALNVTLLYGFNEISFDEFQGEGTNFTNLSLSYNSLEQATIQRISSGAWEEKNLYQMARINYNFMNRYLLTATLRRDGYSGFAENNKIGYFPSLGIGWVVSDENFLSDAEAIDFLKLRATYGVNGNLTSRYSSLARVASGPGSQYVFGDGQTTVNGLQISSLSNPNLSWEKTVGINLGLDFEILKSKISGSVDYYSSTTNDLLWNLILPEITGFRSILTNIGEIKNKGVEVMLNATPIDHRDFRWGIGFNLAANENRIVSLLGTDADGDGREDDLIASGLFIGESIGSVYDYVVEGIWQIGDDIPNGWAAGSYRLKDLNGDGAITATDDRMILGRTEPAYQFGIQNTLDYKNFSLKFFIKSIQGGSDGYLGNNSPGEATSVAVAQGNNAFSIIDYWTPANPGARYRNPLRHAAIDGDQYFSRSFVRLQDISLSYNLNEKLLKNLGLRQLKVFVSGKNLITLTDWQGWDPETGQGLESLSGMPVMKGYSLGINITL